jgi:hypothetical protein
MRAGIVTLNWLKPEDGGRKRPVQGQYYSTVAAFPTIDHPELHRSGWSVVVRFSDASVANPVRGVMHFLVTDAPHEILTEGLEFELREGAQLVATGKVDSVIDVAHSDFNDL